jgi:hypothetical protein
MLRHPLTRVVALAISAVPTLGRQSQDNPPPNPAPSASGTSSTATDSPGKKVWTNEDLPTKKNGVSVVGDKRNQNYHFGSGPAADPATVQRLKKNFEKLQSQLDDVNSKLKTYKEFLEGAPVSKGERDMSKGYSGTPVDQRIAQLSQKKKQLEEQIDDQLAQARKLGIDPGQLR